MTYRRPDICQHPGISDKDIDQVMAEPWGTPLICDDCGEWLYPYDDGEQITILTGEPHGAGDDPAGRPDPATHPEYWTE